MPARAVAIHARSPGASHEQILGIQRSRLLAAAVSVIDELGYGDATVADITSRARVSRRTFYELFNNRDECLVAVFDDVLALVEGEIAAAGLECLSWRERVRGGLWVILSFLDREPALARVCVVQALRGGPSLLERREEILARLAVVVEEGRAGGARGGGCSRLTAEGLVGAAFTIVYARLLRGERGPLTGLLGELMGMIVLPYLGAAAAGREQGRPAPPGPAGVASAPVNTAADMVDVLGGVEMRLTYRTVRVLAGISEHPGASNREVAEHAGIHDAGQISKLLARLERLGMVLNTGQGHAKGEPNEWSLTPRGENVARGIHAHAQPTGGSVSSRHPISTSRASEHCRATSRVIAPVATGSERQPDES
jgi:AcrR family transcriptional regulator